MTLPGGCTLYYLPTEISSVQFFRHSAVPINMEAENGQGYYVGATGSPDLYARQISADTVLASLIAPEVPYGPWYVSAVQKGPFGPSGAPTEPVSTSAFAWGQRFDAAVSSDIGDLWADLTLNTSTFTSGLMLAPGQRGTINVIITPAVEQVGTTVSGFLYIDTFNPYVTTGDEVVRLPYTYTVAAP